MNDDATTPSKVAHAARARRENNAEGDDEPPDWGRRMRAYWARRLGRERPKLRRSLLRLIANLPGASEDRPLSEGEAAILQNLLVNRHRAVGDHMVPRAEIASLPVTASRAEAVRLMRQRGRSRIPVYRGSPDTTLGFLHAKDLLRESENDAPHGGASLETLLRPLIFASPAMTNLELLRLMRQRRIHMALVVDEFGGVDGLITFEDLIEELIGEIHDEHDEHEREPELRLLSDGSLIAAAHRRLDSMPEQLAALLAHDAEEEDIDTIGGFAAWLAGRVPHAGETLRHEPSGLRFVVLQATPRRILRLRIAPRENGTTAQKAEERAGQGASNAASERRDPSPHPAGNNAQSAANGATDGENVPRAAARRNPNHGR